MATLESMAIMGILTPPNPPEEVIDVEVAEAPLVMQVTETETGGGGDGAAGGCEGIGSVVEG